MKKEKAKEEKELETIEKEACGILCSIKTVLVDYVLVLAAILKILVLVILCYIGYKIYACCSTRYRRI